MQAAPDFAKLIRLVIEKAKAEGIAVTLNTAYRSNAYQQELIDCWNDSTNNFECRKRRGIVHEPSQPGLSYHNWGRAIDFEASPVEKRGRVGEIAQALGLRYGVLFGDPVHIDDGKKFTITEAKDRFVEGALVEI